ncbi:LIC11966 family surface protein [Chryseobacterium sp. 22458]|uniref:LIC11966 family surface protein n=1 Tax=Chryseobacterium sp. 22458 TaxID=3453921 RepID=UPI003F867368
MTKKILLGSLIIGTLSLMSCGGSGNSDPASYNNEIITVINGSETNISEMNTAMAGSDYAKAEEVRVKWDKQLDTDIKKVENLGDFKGDASFQTAVLTGLKGYKKIVTESYPKLIEIRKNKTADPAVENKLLNEINEAYQNMANNVNKASADFESKYKK